jgi:hypothetical protein
MCDKFLFWNLNYYNYFEIKNEVSLVNPRYNGLIVVVGEQGVRYRRYNRVMGVFAEVRSRMGWRERSQHNVCLEGSEFESR